MIASVKLPNDDAQVDASRYDNDRGGKLTVSLILTSPFTDSLSLSLHPHRVWWIWVCMWED